ncbi:MAG: hypothetical protein MHM6MM_000972 [Cercozoa sp. M6MM]
MVNKEQQLDNCVTDNGVKLPDYDRRHCMAVDMILLTGIDKERLEDVEFWRQTCQECGVSRCNLATEHIPNCLVPGPKGSVYLSLAQMCIR